MSQTSTQLYVCSYPLTMNSRLYGTALASCLFVDIFDVDTLYILPQLLDVLLENLGGCG